ncbi:hypothetical protein ENSA5_61220 [Enhygromyxa salina]|uniref:Uncharacterized protein n=1 Tax=Enhygromyxa salina TaxID=215803 RepID=A0A2S9XD76_9BACT|nr:hypothetical protein [Enhygromyxa salina]PRP90802.1 hypothetical protein ENSA5_61220 [Enhygromyxa salina]
MIQNDKTAFDELPWHDSTLLSVEIDRARPGERDEVVIRVEWPDESRQLVRFRECYAATMELNFGVAAPESILEANSSTEGAELLAVREKWAPLGVDLSGLMCFEVITNSTASRMRVYALGFEVEADRAS